MEIMMRIAQDQYVPAADAAFGALGAQALRNTLAVVRALYRHVEPELITGSLVVVHRVSDGSGGSSLYKLSPSPECFSGVEMLATVYDASARAGAAAIEVLPSGKLDLHLEWESVDLVDLSMEAIVYVYDGEGERFFIGGKEKAVYDPSSGVHASVFAIPTFRTLEAALEAYKIRFVSTSQCPILAGVWTNGTRLILRNKPEEAMRQSLTHYLKAVIPTTEVRPEQVVDESHPVDINVTWLFTTRLALIEIKWVGDALTKEGNLLPYRDARAREGAKQLAEYLDANASQAPTHETIGYLVVIDARRRGLQLGIEQLPISDAMWYADREIEYEPAYHTFRPDFAEPVRMFAEPALSACKPG
ncbi:MAG TPA: hypothetical protein DCQ04_04895 [Actinobacteria bacterium]|nr:hypothetical protein [Actinomycetota bacterium]